jgi:hypothetical protein
MGWGSGIRHGYGAELHRRAAEESIPYPMKDIFCYVLLTAAFFSIMQLSSDWPMIGALAFNTLFIVLFVAYIIYRDLPLKSLPVIGKYFRK